MSQSSFQHGDPTIHVPFGCDGDQLAILRQPQSWFLPLLNHICALGALPPGWDSYGALPIDRNTAAAAVSLMQNVLEPGDPHPAVVPTNRGGVLLEWHEGGIDLEIEVRSPSSVHVSFEDGDVDEEHEQAGVALIQEKLKLLRSRLNCTTGNG